MGKQMGKMQNQVMWISPGLDELPETGIKRYGVGKRAKIAFSLNVLMGRSSSKETCHTWASW